MEELLFESDNLLSETYNRTAPIIKGDIIMANNGVSDRELGMDIQTPHRIFVVQDATGEIGHRIFKGYLISSVKEKANFYNKKFPKNIYINNYETILQRGPKYNTENLINLSDLYTVEEEKISADSSLWKGHAKQEFIDFIDKIALDIEQGKDVSKVYWIK